MAGRRGGSGSNHCTVEYDGASKGNPGRSGGGAVIRDSNTGRTINVRAGLGHSTNNAAEYAGLNRGLEVAREHGYDSVTVRGDSELVHRQITGQYQTRSPNLQGPHREATTRLANDFTSFTSEHVPRGDNAAADYQANRGAYLGDGQVEFDYSD